MLAASFMQPKYLCPALSGHAHICAYTRVALNLIQPVSAQSERDMYNRLQKKIVIEVIQVNDMRRSPA